MRNGRRGIRNCHVAARWAIVLTDAGDPSALYSGPAAADTSHVMSAPPLTHHEILELVAPFTRRGRHVDLGASDRLARRLRFRPVGHAGHAQATPTLIETLELESLPTGTQRLRRILAHPCGLNADAESLGTQPAGLLAALEAFDPQQQFRAGPGYVIARSYVLSSGPGAAPPLLRRGVVQLAGLQLTLTLPAVRGVAAELTLAPAPGESLDLPEDLLAVLGWNWTRLVRQGEGWKSKLRLPGSTARRGARAEDALERAAAHLARTLEEPPAAFHDRSRAARYGAWVRRAIPMLTLVALIGVVASMAHFGLGRQSGMWILFFQLPTALIALSFCLQELPQYEIPPWPRRARHVLWRR